MIRGRVVEVTVPVIDRGVFASGDEMGDLALPEALRFCLDEQTRLRLLMLRDAVANFKQTTREQSVEFSVPMLFEPEWLFDIAAAGAPNYVDYDHHPYQERCIIPGKACTVHFMDENRISVRGIVGLAVWNTAVFSIADLDKAWTERRTTYSVKAGR